MACSIGRPSPRSVAIARTPTISATRRTGAILSYLQNFVPTYARPNTFVSLARATIWSRGSRSLTADDPALGSWSIGQ